MTKGNLAIKNAARDGKKYTSSSSFLQGTIIYQGVFEMVDYIFEDEKDENGYTRKECKFRLRKVL